MDNSGDPADPMALGVHYRQHFWRMDPSSSGHSAGSGCHKIATGQTGFIELKLGLKNRDGFVFLRFLK